jgi:hypothetical protein
VVRVVACSDSRHDLCSIVVLTSWSWPLLGRLYLVVCGGDVECKRRFL